MMITYDARDIVYRVAKATEGAIEVGVNAGPYVTRVLKRTNNKAGEPWCAAWITDIGVWALSDYWPVKRSARVQTISEWAVSAGCRVKPVSGVHIEPMDLIVMWYPSLNRHAHIYFATEIVDTGGKVHRVKTLEGNTSDPENRDPKRDREGWLVTGKTRTLGPLDRIIKWPTLIKQDLRIPSVLPGLRA